MACRKSNNANRNKKQRIYVRDGGKCHYCEIECRPFGVDQKNHHDSATVDHIQTRASGGGNHDNNLVLSCYRCNNLRSCIPYNIFKHEQLWLKENQNRCTKVSRLFALGTMNMTQGKVWLLEMYMDPLGGPTTVQNWAMFSNAASVHQYMATKFPEAVPNDDDGELGYIGYHFKKGHVLEDVSFVANAWDLQE